MDFNKPIRHPKILAAVLALLIVAIVSIFIAAGDFKTASYCAGSAIAIPGTMIVLVIVAPMILHTAGSKDSYPTMILFTFVAIVSVIAVVVFRDLVLISYALGVMISIIIFVAVLTCILMSKRIRIAQRE